MTTNERLTVYETARALKISVDAVYRLCQSGKLLAAKRVNGRWSVYKSSVDNRIKEKAARNGKRR